MSSHASPSVCGHVGLMTDTVIANSSIEDLRAVVRALLVSGTPHATKTFHKVVRQRLVEHGKQKLPPPSALYTVPFGFQPGYTSASSSSSSSSSASSLYFDSPSLSPASSPSASLPSSTPPFDLASPEPTCSPQFNIVATRARAMFGAGMAIRSLPILTLLVSGTRDLRWSEDGPFLDELAVLDSDIAQAIQSSVEEVATGVSLDVITSGKVAMANLARELRAREKEVESWGGEFPFQRGLANLDWLEQSDVWLSAMRSSSSTSTSSA